jgi:hypothetical protein
MYSIKEKKKIKEKKSERVKRKKIKIFTHANGMSWIDGNKKRIDWELIESKLISWERKKNKQPVACNVIKTET